MTRAAPTSVSGSSRTNSSPPNRAMTSPTLVISVKHGHVREDAVAGEVPVRVVDLLEMIEIEHDDAEPASRGEDLFPRAKQGASVRDAGELVGQGERLQRLVFRVQPPLHLHAPHGAADLRDDLRLRSDLGEEVV